MSDVLKQVEEALELYANGPWCEAKGEGFRAIDGSPRKRLAVFEDQGGDFARAALAALRGLEWKPLSELGTTNPGLVTVGRWLGEKWVTEEFNCYADIIAGLGYTHYTRPILPTPPKREVENAG